MEFGLEFDRAFSECFFMKLDGTRDMYRDRIKAGMTPDDAVRDMIDGDE